MVRYLIGYWGSGTGGREWVTGQVKGNDNGIAFRLVVASVVYINYQVLGIRGKLIDLFFFF